MPLTRVRNSSLLPRPIRVVNTPNIISIDFRSGHGSLHYLTPLTAVTTNWGVYFSNLPTTINEASDFVIPCRILYHTGGSTLDPIIYRDNVNVTNSFQGRSLGASTNSLNVLDVAWMYRSSQWFLYYATRPMTMSDLVNI